MREEEEEGEEEEEEEEEEEASSFSGVNVENAHIHSLMYSGEVSTWLRSASLVETPINHLLILFKALVAVNFLFLWCISCFSCGFPSSPVLGLRLQGYGVRVRVRVRDITW